MLRLVWVNPCVIVKRKLEKAAVPNRKNMFLMKRGRFDLRVWEVIVSPRGGQRTREVANGR